MGDFRAVKPHVLRYWEQEFPQLNIPAKRRYYQYSDVLMIRKIRAYYMIKGLLLVMLSSA